MSTSTPAVPALPRKKGPKVTRDPKADTLYIHLSARESAMLHEALEAAKSMPGLGLNTKASLIRSALVSGSLLRAAVEGTRHAG